MASPQASGSTGPHNPTIVDVAPDVISIGPDFLVGGVAFELFDLNANAGFRTILDVGDALDAALRMVGAAIRLRRILTP